MIALINQMFAYGYAAPQILKYLTGKLPGLSQGINTAQKAGYSAENILKYLSNKIPHDKKKVNEQLNSNEKYMRENGYLSTEERNARNAKYLKGALGVGAGILATAPYAARAYGLLSQGMQQLPHAPNAPTPPQPNAPAPTQLTPTAGNAPITTGLAQTNQPVTPPTQSNTPTPTQPQTPNVTSPAQPNAPVTPEEKAFVAGEQEIQTLWDMAKSGKRAGGPADDFLKTANKLIKSGDLQDYDTFKQFRKWWKTTEGGPRGNPLVEFELFRNQTSSWTGKQPEMRVGGQVDTPKGRATLKELKNKVGTVAFESGEKGQYDHGKLKPLAEAKPKAREYANALYKMPSESEQEWDQRKTIHSAAKKAAKNILEGKTFLDLPTPEGASKHYSTAVDILQFMSGVPNVYNDLLDDDEKQELFEASGMSESLRPEKLGDRAIHGAQLSPNMVWNMLVAVEPKLTTMKRPMAQKKSGALKSGEMGSAEFRRQLTHTVYGILSGKNVSTELADKINKISTANPILDKLVQSFKTKKMNETEKELEKLADDSYFSSLFTDELDEMIKRFR